MIQLTDLGWTGASSGIWTAGPDTVHSRSTATEGAPIKLRSGTRAASLGGDDRVGARVALGRALNLAGTLELSEGRDVLTGVSLGGQGIRNTGLVDLGPDDDRIIAAGGRRGLFNNGSILAGAGDDRVEIRRGGLHGSGLIDLGSGNDTMSVDRGTHFIEGGTGRDSLLLPRGRYRIVLSDCGCNLVVLGRGTALAIDDMERIGSSRSGDTLALREGTLAIGGDGTVGFL